VERVIARHRVRFFDTTEPSWIALHGFTQSPEAWVEVAAAARGAVKLAAIALPGHDPATPVLDARGFEGAVEDIADVLRAISPEPIGVVGYSMGARFALALAAEHPELLARAVLIGVNPGLESVDALRERAREDAKWIEILRAGGLEAFLAAWEAQPLFSSQRALTADQLSAQSAIRRRHDPLGLAGALESFGLSSMPSYWRGLPDLEPPIHVVVGERDPKFRAIADRIAADRARASIATPITVLEGVGHNAVLESPLRIAQILAAV
jgi:2-succinyl-6-hydroxy-2,4-cyclohexadiene-1-carboxylate synthase